MLQFPGSRGQHFDKIDVVGNKKLLTGGRHQSGYFVSDSRTV